MFRDHDQGPIEVILLSTYLYKTPLVLWHWCFVFITCMENKTPMERNKCRVKCKSVYSGFIQRITLSHFVIIGLSVMNHCCADSMGFGRAVYPEFRSSRYWTHEEHPVYTNTWSIHCSIDSAHRKSIFPPTHPKYCMSQTCTCILCFKGENWKERWLH